MIIIECGSCDAPLVDVDVPLVWPADDLGTDAAADALAQAGFVRCDHCRTFHHRISCFTFHKADEPVPFSSRKAERVERRRLAWLERRAA